jgi:glycosyltransferase involved in cell wall biosynthesis
MLRVAYLFERFPSFGQTFCYREVAELKRQRAEVAIFSIRRTADEPAEDWDAGVVASVCYLPKETELVKEVDRLTRAGQLPPQAVHAIKEWDRRSDFLRLHQAAYIGVRLQEAGIKRVHAHFAGMAARTAYWIKQFFGIDFSLTAHANDIFAPRNFAVGLTSLFDAAKLIVTVSDFAVAHLQEKFPQSANKIHRVYNGIDLEQFALADFKGEIPLVLSIGRLIEKKGFSDLVNACQRLKASGRNFLCEIIGEGPLEESLRAQIRDTGVGDCVQLVGAKTQHEIVERLTAANVFALPCVVTADGDMDNLPTVIMEAMATGLPIVSTPIAGIPEMVRPDENGVLVSPLDDTELANAIDSFLTDRDRARKFGQRSRELAAEKFSVADNVTILRELLELE